MWDCNTRRPEVQPAAGAVACAASVAPHQCDAAPAGISYNLFRPVRPVREPGGTRGGRVPAPKPLSPRRPIPVRTAAPIAMNEKEAVSGEGRTAGGEELVRQPRGE
jgi:hypothetical protein